MNTYKLDYLEVREFMNMLKRKITSNEKILKRDLEKYITTENTANILEYIEEYIDCREDYDVNIKFDYEDEELSLYILPKKYINSHEKCHYRLCYIDCSTKHDHCIKCNCNCSDV